MRSAFAWLLPYFLLFALLNIPSGLQETISLRLEEWRLKKGFFLHNASKERAKSEPASPKIEPPHTSPWVEAHIVSHKQFPWSHMAWIDIGTKTKNLPFPISVGCPVVYGQYLVGIVERVGKETSCVRLLSDPLLRPAVRVERMERDRQKEHAAFLLLHELEVNPTLVPKETHRTALCRLLTSLASTYSKGPKLYLAKGELQGSMNIKRPTLLRGLGFNYDIADVEGPARDIRTGQTQRDDPKLALILPGDMLVTSGYDGLFPKGLFAAYVKEVLPLEEGGFAYEIRAEVACPAFLDLSQVALLPPIPNEPQEDSPDLHALMQQIEAEIGALD